MNTLYTSYTPNTANTVFPLMALLFFLLIIPIRSEAEGTKELDPNTASVAFPALCGRIHLSQDASQQRIPFALVGCAPVYRLNIYISDPANENIYMGFGIVTDFAGVTPLYDVNFQVKDPNDNVVTGFAMASLPTTGAGFIPAGVAGYNQALAGPNISGSVPSGYNPLMLNPTLVGNYYIEFQIPGGSVGRQFETFDITVANGTTPLPGRIWSKAWQLSSNTTVAGANGKTFSRFFVYSTDSIVTSFDCNGLAGGVFSVYCNPYGTANTGDWEHDRQSKNGNGSVIPEYKLFLNDPDPAIFGSGSFGQVCELSSNSHCDGTVDILVKVNKPGTIQFVIDVDPIGVGPEDVTINSPVTGSNGCVDWDTIPWNGLDGFGQPVLNGATIKFNIAYLNGLTNLPLYDIEDNKFGIKVDIVRPSPPSGNKLPLYWDDTELTPAGGSNIVTGCIYPTGGIVTGCHNWTYVFPQNEITHNSWWYYLSEGSQNLTINIIRAPAAAGPITGATTVCQGGTYTYSVPTIQSAQKYVWTLLNSSNVLVQRDSISSPDNTYTYAFGALMTPGAYTLHVKGWNASCGDSTESVISITLNAYTVPVITGPANACINSISNFTAPGGLATYLWSASGGTVQGSAIASSSNILWNTAGNQTVTLVSSTAACPAVTSTLSIFIQALPVPYAGSNGITCQGQPFTINDASITNQNAFTWSVTTGAGSLSNTGTLSPTYTPTPGETGNILITLTGTGLSNCPSVNDQMQLQIIPLPTSFAGNNGNVCQNSTYTLGGTVTNNSSLFWTHNGAGTLSSTSILNPVYTPGGSETGNVTFTLTAVGNTPCGNVSSQVVVTVNPPPVVYAGPTDSICQGSTYTLSGATASNQTAFTWSTSGSGTFDATGAQNPTYTPSASDITNGGVNLTVITAGLAGCSPVSSTMHLHISRQATANAGIDATICQNASYTVTSASAQFYSTLLWTHTGTGSLAASNTLNPIYTPGPGEIGNIQLILQSNPLSPCVAITDQMQLTKNEAAQAFAGPNATICEGGSYTLSASSGSGYAAISWSSSGTGTFDNVSLLHPVYSPSAADILAGSVTLTLTATAFSSCANTVSNMTLIITRQVDVNAGIDETICQNAVFVPTSAGVHFQSGILWTHNGTGTLTGATTQFPTYTPGPGETGTIQLTMTAYAISPCIDASDQMNLTINPPASANAGSNSTICEGSSYTLSSSTASGYTSLLWSSAGTGTFNDATILNPTYSPSPADILAGSVTLTLTAQAFTSCTNAISSLTLNITRQVVVNAGVDATICQTSTYTPAASTAQFQGSLSWSHNGSGALSGATTLTPTYTPGAGETGTIQLTLSGIALNPCANVNDVMNLTINEAAFSNAGADATICEGSTFTLAGSVASGFAGLIWSSSGTGIFNDATILHPVYSPSIADITSGSVNLILTSQAFTSCTDDVDQMTLNITRQIVVNAGADATICQTSTFTPSTSTAQFQGSLLWTHNGSGTLTNPTFLTPVYTPGVGETGTIQLNLHGVALVPCTDVDDVMDLTINEAAFSNAGADATICEGSTFTLAGSVASGFAGLLWTSSGTGLFNDATILHPVYTPSIADIAAGSVNLILTSQAFTSCTDDVDQMTLNITRQVVVNAGTDATICQTSTFTPSTASAQFQGSLLWTHNGAGTLTGASSLTPTYNPGVGETGTIQLTLTGYANIPCADVNDVLNLTINQSAQASAGPNNIICEGSTFTPAGTSVSGNTGILWTTSGSGSFNNTGILNPVYTPGLSDITAGTVVLTIKAVANTGCTDATSSMTLSITRQVLVNAGADATICQTSTFSPTTSTAQFQQSLIWTHTGSGTLSAQTTLNPVYTPGVGETGTITLTLQGIANNPCTDVQDQIQLTINEAALANAGPNATICEGSTYSLSSATASGYANLAWITSGSGLFSNSTIQNPIYTPSVADIASGSVTLTLTSYAFSACTNAVSSMTLAITRQVVVNAGSNGQVCQNTSYTVSGTTAQYFNSINWTHNGAGLLSNINTLAPTYTPAAGESGTITLILNGIANTPCADASDNMQLTIHPLPLANAGPDGSTCEGFNFTVSGSSATNYNNISWTRSGTGNLLNATTLSPTYVPGPGETGVVTLTMTVTGTNSCSAESSVDAMVLNITPLPFVTAGADATICAANTYNVSGTQQFCGITNWTSSGDGTFTNPGSLVSTYVPGPSDIAAGTVTLTLTGAGVNSCAAVNSVDQLVLTIDPMPAINAGPDASYCITGPVQLTGTSAAFYSSIQWFTSGDGILTNPLTIAPTYMPGNIDYNNGTVTLTLWAQGRLSCASQTVTDDVIWAVAPYPIVLAGPDDYICSNVTQFQLNGLGNNYNGANIQWSFAGGDGFLSNANIMNPVYFAGPVDLSTQNRSIMFTLTLQGNGSCSGVFVNDQIELKIDPTPESNAGPDDEICDQRPYQMNATGQYQSSMTWTTSGDGTFSNTNIFNPIYTPGPNDVGQTVVLTLQVQGCQSLTGGDFMWLTVHEDPSATISGTTSICEATATPVTIDLTGTPPWSVTYTNGVTPVTVNNIMITPYVFNVTPPVTSSYWISASNDVNCTTPADSIHGLVSITVIPLPDPFTTTATNAGVFCEGTAGVTLGLSGSQVGMTYELLFNGLPEGTTLPGTGSPLSFGIKNIPGQYSILGTNPVGNCQKMMNDTVTVIMNPIPVTDFTTNTVCNSDTTFFTISGNFIQNTSQWHWDFGDGTFATFNAPTNPYHIYPTYGTYLVILSVEDTNNCTYSISHPVEVRPHPTAFFSYNTPNCLGDATQFTELSINPAGQGYINQWIWNFGDGSPNDTINFPTTANPVHSYAGAGTYLVTLSIVNSRGCTDIYSSTITVTRRPLADFDFWSNCQDELAIFNDASNTNGGGAVTSWSWDFGDPASGSLNTSILEDPTHLYTTAGLYDVTLIVQNFNGCSDTILRQVNVKGAPLADFGSTTGCLGTPTHFWADSTLINLNATATYHWDFGDGSTSNTRNTQYTYIAAGTYTVILTITDTAGCEGSRSHTLTVTPPPTALFSSATDNCQGQTISFNNQSTTESGYLTSWSWNFGDGSPVQTILFPAIPDVSHIYAVTGTFNVTLTVTNSEDCTHSYSRLVNVFGSPTADFMSSGHCKDSPVHFTDLTTTSGSQSLTSWQWNFGDPGSGVFNTSSDQNPIHSYAATGSYTVTLITLTLNGCSDTISYPVTIKPLPVTDFSFQSACQDNPAQFSPAGMAIPTIASWYWSFGDGGSSTLQSPSHVYTFAGTYTVTLTVTDTAGCENQRSHPIIIVPLPLVNFDFSSPACDDQQIQFTDLTTSAAGYVTRWFWDFGDGTTQVINFPATASVSHTYAQSGTFNVTLTVKSSDSCSNLQTKTLTILPKPTALFSHGAACQGAAVSFTDLSLSNTTSGISNWQWDFGDPGSGSSNQSSQQNPIHNFNTAGTYTVRLIAIISGGCSDTVTSTVNVTPPPLVDFSSLAGCSGDTTQFTSSTAVNVNATQSWYWQFGDGLSSTLVDPIHIYAQSGTFNVMLTITDTAGCINTKTNSVVVTPGPLSNFSFNTPACSGTEITFTDLGNGNGGIIGNWYWQFGDDTDTTFTTYHPTVTHTYTQPGTFLVSLTLGTQQGCSHTRVIPVTISASPLTAFNYQNTCQGQATQFTDQTSLNGGPTLVSHSWNFGDPPSGSSNTSTQTNPVHNYANPGTYLVRLITANASGCQDTLEQNVSIVPKPGVDFYNDSLLCLGSATTFFTDTTATQVGAVQTYNWNFGDGSPTGNTQNPQHSYGVAGTFTVILTISDTSGCENAISHPVTIHASPQSYFTIGSACAESPTQFTDLSSAPQGDTLVAWSWDFGLSGTADTSTMQNPQYTFTTAGTYTITLTTTTEHGCTHVKTMPLQVWNKPTAYFKYSASPCANGAVQFQDSSWSYQALVTGWNWEFEPYQYGNGQNPNHVYYAIDSCYDVKLMITDIRGCVDTAFQQVCVPSELTATFSYTQSCFGEPMQFTPQLLTPAAPADSLISFQWNFGDPQSGAQNLSTLKTPGHIFTAPGFYTINFSTIDQFGCQADDYQSVQVHALPVALFDYTPGSCDSTITFTSQSIDTASAITTMYWNFGDGTLDTINAPNTSTTHKYITAGSYEATLTVVDGNGCTATVTDSIQRSPCIVAAYTPSDTLLCQNYALAFSDFSTCDALISQWVWTWGDTAQPTTYNSYQSLTTHTFTQPGTFLVKLKVSTIVGGSVISDSTQRVITVIATPLAGFTTQDVCYMQQSMFTDTTKANGATLLNYRWEFGDPQSVYDTAVNRNPSWIYPAPGSYDPRLIVTNQSGCRDTATTSLIIHGLPSATFNSSIACVGHPTYFFDHSDPYLAPLNLWGWRVSDSLGRFLGSMQGSTPEFVFDSIGRYRVLLTASDTNQCADTLRAEVNVEPSPLSAFSYTEDVEQVQGQVQFNDGSIGADEYHWDFGNGEISPLASPLITYTEDGTYTVTLVTLNEQGCSDTTSMLYTLLFKGLYVPNAFAPGGTLQQTRIWKPVGQNLATYHCQVYNSHGAMIWESKQLDERGSPVESWDGTYKGHPVQQDVYVWKIQAIFRDGTIWNNKDVGNHDKLTEPVFGTIVLIR